MRHLPLRTRSVPISAEVYAYALRAERREVQKVVALVDETRVRLDRVRADLSALTRAVHVEPGRQASVTTPGARLAIKVAQATAREEPM
jgi:hypothetical protein